MINSTDFKAFNTYYKNLKDFDIYKDWMDQKFINKDFLFDIKDIYLYFDAHNVDYYVYYCFQKLRDWIKKNERYTSEFINNLEQLIKKLGIKNKLGSNELQYLNHLKAVVFSKKRNLKNLIVDFGLENFNISKNNKKYINEQVYFNFDSSNIVEQDSTKKSSCQIYFSNHRIIICKNSYVMSIYFKDIHKYRLSGDYIEIVVNINPLGNKIFKINSDDIYVMYVSLERMLNYWTKKYYFFLK